MATLEKLIDILNKNIAPATQETPAAPGTEPPAAQTPPITMKLELKKEDFNGNTIETIQLPFMGPGLAPCFTTHKDFLIISTSLGSVKDIINVKEGKQNSLEKNTLFKQVNYNFPSLYGQVGFVNFSKLMVASIDITDWIISFRGLLPTPPAGTPNTMGDIGTVLKDNLIPFFEACKTLKGIGMCSEVDKSGVKQTINIYIKNSED